MERHVADASQPFDMDEDLSPGIDESPTSYEARSAVREARRRLKEQRAVDQRRQQERHIREAGQLLESGSADRAEISSTSIPPKDDSRSADLSISFDAPGQLHFQPARQMPSAELGRSKPKRVPASVEFSSRASHFERSQSSDAEQESTGRPVASQHHTDSPILPPAAEPQPSSNAAGSDRRSMAGETEPLPVEEVRRSMGLPELPRQPRQRVDRPVSRSLQPELTDVRDSRPAVEPAVPPRPTTWITGAGSIPLISRNGASSSGDLNLPSALEADPIDNVIDLHSVPRCCGTCRDFKRIDESGRGWCTNGHAFPERRMVESDGLACRSSIGVWWLPHDELWLERADTTHHGRPTPMLDGMSREPRIERPEMEPRYP
jgi:hypothetical protein